MRRGTRLPGGGTGNARLAESIFRRRLFPPQSGGGGAVEHAVRGVSARAAGTGERGRLRAGGGRVERITPAAAGRGGTARLRRWQGSTRRRCEGPLRAAEFVLYIPARFYGYDAGDVDTVPCEDATQMTSTQCSAGLSGSPPLRRVAFDAIAAAVDDRDGQQTQPPPHRLTARCGPHLLARVCGICSGIGREHSWAGWRGELRL